MREEKKTKEKRAKFQWNHFFPRLFQHSLCSHLDRSLQPLVVFYLSFGLTQVTYLLVLYCTMSVLSVSSFVCVCVCGCEPIKIDCLFQENKNEIKTRTSIEINALNK